MKKRTEYITTKTDKRIFITGDKHGTFNPFFGLAEKIELFDTDILIIAGDAGYVWNESYHNSVETLEQIFPGTIAFIDGNHENHQILGSLKIECWSGGRVHRIGERAFHLMRGEIYSIYDNNIFTFGGARSVDQDRREEGISWWKEEEPTAGEIAYGAGQIDANKDKIDYVVTHESPLFARKAIPRPKPVDEDYHLPAIFDSWYERISEGDNFKKWYFGHMHVNQLITPKLRGIHNEILPLGREECIPWT